ncbi:Fe-S oxidoreductase, partial [Streptomyces fructofermentans]
MQLVAIVVSLVLIVVGFALFGRATAQIYRFVRLGGRLPAGARTDHPYRRSVTLVREFLGHTRMNRWGVVGFAHWFVAIGFYCLLLTLVNATGQLFAPDWVLPVLGHFTPYNMLVEFLGVATVLGILTLIAVRRLNRPARPGGKSRFAGSKAGQAYFIEAVIVVVGTCIVVLHALEGAIHDVGHYEAAYFLSYPLVARLRELDAGTLDTLVYAVAGLKITASFVWMIVVSLNTNMGVAWHRFLGFPNIWFKREADGASALGALQPMVSGGRAIDFTDPGDDDVFGVSQVEQFSWKGLLDFS